MTKSKKNERVSCLENHGGIHQDTKQDQDQATDTDTDTDHTAIEEDQDQVQSEKERRSARTFLHLGKNVRIF